MSDIKLVTIDAEGSRRRTVTWSDPSEVMAKATGIAGVDAVRGMASGLFPVAPMAELFGLQAVSVEEGRVVIAACAEEMFSNGMGAAHGGYAATLLDSAAWLALHSRCGVGQFCSTVQLNVHFLRNFPLDGSEVRCEGRVLHFTSSTATAEAFMFDGSGKRLAHATTHCLVRRAPRRT